MTHGYTKKNLDAECMCIIMCIIMCMFMSRIQQIVGFGYGYWFCMYVLSIYEEKTVEMMVKTNFSCLWL